jgi:hypothetical protein
MDKYNSEFLALIIGLIVGGIALYFFLEWIFRMAQEFLDGWRSTYVSSLTIKVTQMSDLGKPVAFTVVAKNASGRVVPDSGITVTATGGSATVNPDGSGGSFTGTVEGPATLVATDGKITSSVVTIDVVDATPATLEIILS